MRGNCYEVIEQQAMYQPIRAVHKINFWFIVVTVENG